MKILPSYDYGCKNSKFFVDIIGTGYATGLGKHTVNISYCSFDGLNSNDIIYGLLTFNNGDKIYSELIYATSPDENGNWQQYWKIYDGTGRFYNVVGLIGLKIVGDFTHLTWINSGHGILIYRSSIY